MPDEILFYLFAVTFIGVWLFASRMLAWQSRWTDLYSQYPANGQRPTRNLYFQGGYVGRTSHAGTLVLGTDDTAFYARTILIFSFGHGPLRIPWGDIKASRERRFLRNMVVLKFSRVPEGSMHVGQRTAEWLARQSAGQLQIPDA